MIKINLYNSQNKYQTNSKLNKKQSFDGVRRFKRGFKKTVNRKSQSSNSQILNFKTLKQLGIATLTVLGFKPKTTQEMLADVFQTNDKRKLKELSQAKFAKNIKNIYKLKHSRYNAKISKLLELSSHKDLIGTIAKRQLRHVNKGNIRYIDYDISRLANKFYDTNEYGMGADYGYPVYRDYDETFDWSDC